MPIRRTKKSVHDKNTCQGRIRFRGATLVQEKLPALDGILAYSRQLTYALRRKILGYCLSLRLCGSFDGLRSAGFHRSGSL